MTTPRLILAELVASQSQPHVPINSALRRLDAVVQLSVVDILINTPPGSPADGDAYIVGSAPTGAWAGFAAGSLAIYIATSWVEMQPLAGWLAYVQADSLFYYYDVGSPVGWSVLSTSGNGSAPNPQDYFERMYDFDDTLPLAGSSGSNWLTDNSGAGADCTYGTSDANHFGIYVLSTGTTETGTALMTIATASGTARSSYILGTDPLVIEMLVNIPTLPTGTETFYFAGGLRDSSAFGNRISCGIRWDGSAAKWRINTNGGGSSTNVDGSGTPTTGWHLFKMEATSTELNVYVDGVLVATVTTNLPTAGMTPFLVCGKSAGSTARTVSVDFMRITKTFSTPRY